MMRLRPATEADFRAYVGIAPDPGWSPWFCDWCGQVVERDGHLLAFGAISEDEYGRFWAWLHCRERLPAIVVHRSTMRTLRSLRRAGADVVHCYRDEAQDGSERWLRRLGFMPAPEMNTPRGKLVWKCAL